MAGKPQDHPMIRDKRASRADDGEPLYDTEMSLIPHGGSVSITIPSMARKMHSFDAGRSAVVEIYADGIWIGAGGDETDE